MRAVCYCRVSTEEQVQGYSLDKQEEECIRLIKNSGYTFVESYVDDGYSAKDTNRPALQRMMSDITRQQFDMVVVWNSDRLSRDVIDGLTIVKTVFNKHNIKFASVTEDIDTSTPDGMMMFTMRLMFAQRERERIGERVSMGLAKKASTGRRVNLSPIYGYDVVEGKLVVNDTEAEIVRRIFELYVYQGWGYGKIAESLIDVPAKKTEWYHSTVKGILKNYTYIGMNKHTPKNGETIYVQGEHEPIVSMELFDLAQNKLKRRKDGDMSRSSYPYPFSTIVKCGACGASYTANNTVRRRNDRFGYTNYRCGNRKPGKCKEPDISEMKLERLFFDYFASIEIEAEEYTPPKDNKRADKEKARIEKEIKKFENRKNNLLDDLGDRLISREDYKTKVTQINDQLDRLKDELDKLQPDEEPWSAREVIDLIKDLETNWPNMKPEDRKFMVQFLFKRIEILKDPDWRITKIDPA